ncbi:uncharacterized protein si:ch211-108d22.2 isoform X3 [Acipenser ruthenus]|uniref:uncharacterized protein si:ch211-108d22.2 isoform X3 n=1 Tax=Acipenser ruthenus TaxID=7906 RepID=UPI0027414088|nr:uncharacterized protein si:ch211-108d22.2 isoform X3 [Acipenser ruthenus]
MMVIDLIETEKLLDMVTKKGERASRLFLQQLYNTRKRTLPEDLHPRISCLDFVKDDETDIGASSCQAYQNKLKSHGKDIIDKEWKKIRQLLGDEEKRIDLKYIPVVLDTDKSEIYKSKKYKKSRPKKMKLYIPVDKRKMVIDDLFKTHEKTILLVGKPGIGKTVAAQQLMNLWIDRKRQVPNYMFYFDELTLARMPTSLNLKSLLFDNYCRPDNTVDEGDVFHDIEQNSKMVFIIFDGISEHFLNSITTDTKSLIYRIIEKKLLPQAKILIACRPHTEYFQLDESTSYRVEVLGFSEDSIKDYFKTVLAGKENAISLDLFSLCHVPMYAYINACCILSGYCKSDSQPTTVTEIYVHIFRYSIGKHGAKAKGHPMRIYSDAELAEYRGELMPLAKTAFYEMQHKSVNFINPPLAASSVENSFLRYTCEVRDSVTSRKTYFAFLHNTMQEFCAALWLLKNPSEINEIIQRCRTPDGSHLRYMVFFLCGFLAKNNAKLLTFLFPESHKNTISSVSPGLINKLIEGEDCEEADILFACQCLYEAQSPGACLQFLKEMDFDLYLESQLDPSQCCAVAYVIKQAQEEKVKLNLKHFIASDTKLKLLLGCMGKIEPHRLAHEDIVLFIRSMYSIQRCENLQENVVSFQNLIGRELKYTACSYLLNQDVESLKWFIQISSEEIQLHLNGYIAACVSLVARLSGLSNWRLTDETILYICKEIPVNTSEQFLKGLHHRICFSRSKLDGQDCTALASVISNSAMPVELDISQCDLTSNAVCTLNTCTTKLSILRMKQEMYPELWRSALEIGQENEINNLLRLCGNEIHLPVEETVFSRAAQVINRSEQKIVVCLHWIYSCDQLGDTLIDPLLTCLPNIDFIRFPELSRWNEQSAECKQKAISFLLDMVPRAADYEKQTGHRSDFTFSSYSTRDDRNEAQTEFLLDLYSLGKEYETQTGKEVLQTSLPVYQSVPETWIMDLTKRKASLFLEIFTFYKVKRPVELRNWTTEESELRSFLECLQYISELRLPELSMCDLVSAECKQKAISFLLDMVQRAAEYKENTGHRVLEPLLSAFSLSFSRYNEDAQTEFLIDLYSLGKEYETQTGKEVLQTLLPVYQSYPKTWIMNLTKRKASLFLEIFTFYKVKRPVKLWNWTTEESELRRFLECLQYISELRFHEHYWWYMESAEWKKAISFLLDMVQRAAEYEEQTGHRVLEQLLSAFSLSFDDEDLEYQYEAQSEFLLDLYSLGKEYETQTGKKVLQTLLPVYQSFPETWSMDLTERKASLFLEIFTFYKVKRPVKLWNWTTEESQLRSFLECLQYISELRFPELSRWNVQSAEWKKATSFLLDMILRSVEYEEQTGHRVLEPLLSAFSLSFDDEDLEYRNEAQTEFLLDLYSRGKEYETQTGKEVLQTLLTVYQSIPETWSMDLTKRKASLFLEIFTFYKVKRPAVLRNWTTEDSELRSLLECFQYISELRFPELSRWNVKSAEWKQEAISFLLDMVQRAAEYEEQAGHRVLEQLLSVFSLSLDDEGLEYRNEVQSEFLLDLYSLGKDYETLTGKEVLQTLLPVYQSVPETWIMDLTERKASLFLEIFTFYKVKRPVKLRNWTTEDSELRSLLECFQYISELSCDDRAFLNICKTLSTYDRDEAKKQSCLFMKKLDPALTLPSLLTTSSCRSIGKVLRFSGSNLKLSLTPSNISLKGIHLLTKSWTHLEKLRMNEMLIRKVTKQLMSRRQENPVTVEEITLDLSSTKRKPRRVCLLVSNLAFILRHWTVSCLDLSACTIEGYSLVVLLCQQKHVTIKLSEESLQQLALAVYEAQEFMLAASFLEKVDHDLTPCNLTWEVLHFLLQHARQRVKVNFRKSKLQENNMKELTHLLPQIHTLRLSAEFCKRIVQEIVQKGDCKLIFSFLEATDNWLNLNNTVLSSTDCDAILHFIDHSNNVRLNLLWTSISEDDTEKLLLVIGKVSKICLERHMLLRFLHRIYRSKDPGAACSFLKALQGKLNFSTSDTIDITEEESSFCLTLEDCRAISTALLLSGGESELVLDDCEVQDDGLEWLFNVFQNVKLRTNKMILQRLLLLAYENDKRHVKMATCRGLSLSAATRNEMDLSDTPLNEDTCRALAHVVHSSEGGWELDLSNCRLSDQCINQLQTCLPRIQVLDLSKNDITDSGAMIIHEVVYRNPSLKTVRLFNNKIKNMRIFRTDSRYEIW